MGAGWGYDRNLFTARVAWSEIHYVHDNPVKRGLCEVGRSGSGAAFDPIVGWRRPSRWTDARGASIDLRKSLSISHRWVPGVKGWLVPAAP